MTNFIMYSILILNDETTPIEESNSLISQTNQKEIINETDSIFIIKSLMNVESNCFYKLSSN